MQGKKASMYPNKLEAKNFIWVGRRKVPDIYVEEF